MSRADLKGVQKQKKNNMGKEVIIWNGYFENKLTEEGR